MADAYIFVGHLRTERSDVFRARSALRELPVAENPLLVLPVVLSTHTDCFIVHVHVSPQERSFPHYSDGPVHRS